ncbi:MAG: family 20 glycosylhydrolase [Bacteroidales bacterium]|nr:family 20 glycosylhydrolase [Bacteroidales bacterium]
MKKNDLTLSRRAFLSSVAVVGAGSALKAARIQGSGSLLKVANEFEDASNYVEESDSRLLKRLIPQPAYVRLNDDKAVLLNNMLTVNVELGTSDTQARRKVSDIFRQYFGSTPTINVAKTKDLASEEAYRIRATDSTLTLSATSFAGIRHALSTLRQLAEANNDTEKLVCYRIPEMEIEDSPTISFRGMHLCWFPETEVIQIEQYIRWAAYYKFNYIIIEFWGTYPFVSKSFLSWREYKTTLKDIKRLVKIGKELGVTLIPQINIFGHASGSRRASGKHAILDLYPEYQPLFEPDGWTWCLSNPLTRKILSSAILETFEAFENPPFYHIGGDEAWGSAECYACRHADYEALLIDHLKYFHQLLLRKNSRMMMWHDMLISKSNPKWKEYVANGGAKAENILRELPKDIVICDWQYGTQYSTHKKNETWPTMSYFKELGFDVLACPWNNIENIKSLGEKVRAAKLYGLLCTTWFGPSIGQMLNIMTHGAQAAWSKSPYGPSDRIMGMRHLRQIGWDIPIKNYPNTGVHKWQVRPDTYP